MANEKQSKKKSKSPIATYSISSLMKKTFGDLVKEAKKLKIEGVDDLSKDNKDQLICMIIQKAISLEKSKEKSASCKKLSREVLEGLAESQGIPVKDENGRKRKVSQLCADLTKPPVIDLTSTSPEVSPPAKVARKGNISISGSDSIISKLEEKQWKRMEAVGDGNCFYDALIKAADSQNLKQRMFRALTGEDDGDVKDLRKKVAFETVKDMMNKNVYDEFKNLDEPELNQRIKDFNTNVIKIFEKIKSYDDKKDFYRKIFEIKWTNKEYIDEFEFMYVKNKLQENGILLTAEISEPKTKTTEGIFLYKEGSVDHYDYWKLVPLSKMSLSLDVGETSTPSPPQPLPDAGPTPSPEIEQPQEQPIQPAIPIGAVPIAQSLTESIKLQRIVMKCLGLISY